MAKANTKLIPLKLEGTWQITRGNWQISENEQEFIFQGYPREDDANQDRLCLSNHKIIDGVFEAEIMVDDIVLGETNAQLVFRYQDLELYSFAGLGGWEYKYVIAQRTPGESALNQPGWAPVNQDSRIEDIIPNHWYFVKVDFSNQNIDLFLGDVCVLRHVSNNRSRYYPAGNVGLRAFGKQQVHYRNPKLFQRIRTSDINAHLHSVDLSFIKDATLQAIAKHDLEQVKTLDADEAPKAVVVLLGSIAECILLDTILFNETQAKKCSSAKKTSIRNWNLDTLINVANELKTLQKITFSTSHTLRGYRNLIHPGKPETQELAPWSSQAIAGIDFLLFLIKDITEFASKP